MEFRRPEAAKSVCGQAGHAPRRCQVCRYNAIGILANDDDYIQWNVAYTLIQAMKFREGVQFQTVDMSQNLSMIS